MSNNDNDKYTSPVAGLIVLFIIGLIFGGMYTSLHKNDIHDSSAQSVFTHTGVRLRAINDSNSSLEIVKDRNGWLYYYWNLGGYKGAVLEPVFDADGNMTKDMSIFEDQ